MAPKKRCGSGIVHQGTSHFNLHNILIPIHFQLA